MPNYDNISAPVTLSAVSGPGTGSASSSGFAAGIQQSSQASTNAIQELKSGNQDSLLKALGILCNALEHPDEKLPANLKLFPEEMHGMLGVTHNGLASTVGKSLIVSMIAPLDLTQLPLDVKAALEGLSQSVDAYHQLFKTKEAFTLDLGKETPAQKEHFSANCHALCHKLGDISKRLDAAVNEKFDKKNPAAESHASVAKSSAYSTMISSVSTASQVSFMVDLIGAPFREISASIVFSKQESFSPQELNVYNAFSACCKTFSSNNCDESLLALQKLEKAILNFDLAEEMFDQHEVTSPSMSVFIRSVTAEPFIKTLQAFNCSALALTKANEALTFDKEKFSDLTQNSFSRASLLKNYSEGDALHHSQPVSDFCKQFDEAIRHIDQELKPPAHQSGVASSAKASIRTTSALVVAASLINDLTGMMSRELTGSIDFTRNDKGSRAECKVVSQSREKMTGADLDKLMSRVCALQERLDRCQELGVSAPVSLGVSEAVSLGPLIASLNVVAGMYSALRELKTLSASPSIPLQLNNAEKLMAAESGRDVIQSHKDFAGIVGTPAASDNLSLAKHLDTVMQKVVLMHRSKMNFLNPGMDRDDINSAGQSTVAFSQGNSTGFLVGSLGVLALISLLHGMGTEAIMRTLRFSMDTKRWSDGADRVESESGSKTNISFACNATRISEHSLDLSSPAQITSKTTIIASELTFSRTLLIALCNSGALKEMLRRLIKLEKENLAHEPGFADSALISDKLMPQLNNNILKVLDDAEANHNPIPGLNQDMASALSSASKANIATALSTHSAFIAPILKSIAAAKKASIIDEKQKNVAVSAQSELSRIISTALNVIQAFTRNCGHEMDNFRNPMQNSSAIQASDSAIAESFTLSCGVSLVCEELFEICIGRSLTLLDKEKIAQKSKDTRDLSAKDAALSKDASLEDSRLGGGTSSTQVLSALRLTLTHLGVSLRDFAAQLETDPDILRDQLEMHSIQRTLIKSVTSSLLSCSAAMMAISGILSHLPLSTVGSTDALRQFIHSIDHELVLRPIHSSEHSTRDMGSEILLITGISNDCAASIICIATKLLLQSSVLGLDTHLSIAKILEILSLHPHPGDALALELQAMSQPNGSSKNTSGQGRSTLVAGSLATASSTAATKTGDSVSTAQTLRTMQAAVDHQIDQVKLLKDEEEGDSFGLVAFYELLIRMLSGEQEIDTAHYKDLVKRFNRGGISLSSFHSEHGGVLSTQRAHTKNRLIDDNGFLGCDDAAGLLNTFIKKAVQQESSTSLLDKLKLELMKQPKLSKKVKESWAFIVNKVFEHLNESNRRHTLFAPGDTRRNTKKFDEKKESLLHQWDDRPVAAAVLVPTVAAAVLVPSPSNN